MLYSETFSGTENPISSGGQWVNNSVSWHRAQKLTGVVTTTGLNAGFDDSYAHHSGVWGPDVDVTVGLFIDAAAGNCSHENEILLRVTDGNDFVKAYEINCQVDPIAGSFAIFPVHWRGAMGDFFVFSQSGSGFFSGGTAILRAKIVGHIIDAWVDGVHMFTQDVTEAGETVENTGKPGMGFFRQGCDGAFDRSTGFTSFQADDGLSSAVLLGQGAL
jgi:hypothetical protein